MKSLLLPIIAFLIFNCSNNHPAGKFPYQDSTANIDQRVSDLVGRMTLDEKIAQMDMYDGNDLSKKPGHEAVEYSEILTAKALQNTGIGSIHDLYPLSAAITNSIQKYAIEKTRLGIPVLFIEEGLHGYEGKGSSSFPVPLALAGAFDTTLVHAVGRVIATESRAHGINMILGPVICLPRDPRWGRVRGNLRRRSLADGFEWRSNGQGSARKKAK